MLSVQECWVDLTIEWVGGFASFAAWANCSWKWVHKNHKHVSHFHLALFIDVDDELNCLLGRFSRIYVWWLMRTCLQILAGMAAAYKMFSSAYCYIKFCVKEQCNTCINLTLATRCKSHNILATYTLSCLHTVESKRSSHSEPSLGAEACPKA